ncbi:MAG: aminotransferase class I/II-fold pyridoxal phosphate-dependent enzyme [Candidatus Heteroscillospira sp.]|jgi:cystathionine beta-lyase family protein involved in aluminum resistance
MNEKLLELAKRVEARIAPRFAEIDEVSMHNTAKVLEAFREARVSDMHFAGTNGYGHDDIGRDTLDEIYARVFGAESAIVRIGMVSGTHAIACALFAACEPGRKLLSISGMPYDSIRSAIGIEGDYPGSLKYYGVDFDTVELLPDSTPDYDGIRRAAADPRVGAVAIQRSRGYSTRRTLSVDEIAKMIAAVREVNPEACVFVDNCYGEFTELHEPSEFGADLMAGSLIKNPGGGIAPTGGYIVGKKKYVERAAARLTAPGLGADCGATLGANAQLFRGFFMAPHTVAQALKTVVFCAGMLEELGYKSNPGVFDKRSDIVQIIELGTPEKLCAFCRGIQMGSAVDAFVTPVPSDMDGYADQVVMASGSFVQGSTIELSCDGPMREPYAAYLQGGLTYEAGRLGILYAINEMMD